MPTVKLDYSDPNENTSGGTYAPNPRQIESDGDSVFSADTTTSGNYDFFVSTTAGGNFICYRSTEINVIADAASQLVMVLPGQTHQNGVGVTGTPAGWTAGVSSTVYVYAVDDNYNRATGVSQDPIYIESSDPFDIDVGSFKMTAGEVVSTTVTIRTAKATTLTATDNDTSGPDLGDIVSDPFNVSASTASQLQLVLPGETAVPGSSALSRGVIGSPSTREAGVDIPITINITDVFWNVTNATSAIRIVTSDPNDATTGAWPADATDPTDVDVTGTLSTNMRLVTSTGGWTGWTFTATDQDPNPAPYPETFSSFVSDGVNVKAGPSEGLLVLLPGESEDPGTADGRKGTVEDTPAVQPAGVPVTPTPF